MNTNSNTSTGSVQRLLLQLAELPNPLDTHINVADDVGL